jgi:hypothetical protein
MAVVATAGRFRAGFVERNSGDAAVLSLVGFDKALTGQKPGAFTKQEIVSLSLAVTGSSGAKKGLGGIAAKTGSSILDAMRRAQS